MSKTWEHYHHAARHHERAAYNYKQAAKYDEAEEHEKAAHHAYWLTATINTRFITTPEAAKLHFEQCDNRAMPASEQGANKKSAA